MLKQTLAPLDLSSRVLGALERWGLSVERRVVRVPHVCYRFIRCDLTLSVVSSVKNYFVMSVEMLIYGPEYLRAGLTAARRPG